MPGPAGGRSQCRLAKRRGVGSQPGESSASKDFVRLILEHTLAGITFGVMIAYGPPPLKVIGVIGEVGLGIYVGLDAYQSYQESLRIEQEKRDVIDQY